MGVELKGVFFNKEICRVPIKSWVEFDKLEESAREQALNLSSLPFTFKHVALMPDCHFGYGMPIGGVLATRGVIIPNAVGVDIGCGMCAVSTSLKSKDISISTIKEILGEIRKVIPIGYSHHKEPQDITLMPDITAILQVEDGVVNKEYDNARTQLGTLGGGNHFIEIQKDMEDFIWIMLHSGSRNIGLKVANYYNGLAKELNEKYYSIVDSKLQLSFLPVDSREGKDYLDELNYCVAFAEANRKLMMNRIISIFRDKFKDLICGDIINIAHNYVTQENHFGENVWVHRKGATLARQNTIGIIPGSQGTNSYIVEGLGNPESFMSCSHGAGRKLGRKVAQRTLNLQEEINKMNSLGIIHGIRNEKDLDEAAGAYKDIDEVMGNQNDLVKILVKLSPLAVIKGE
jgi:tRNA-splicing ligase RtcB